MTTMSKTSGRSETLSQGTGLPVSDDSARALTNAADIWFAAATECQREMMTFVSMRREKDGEAAREMIVCRDLAEIATLQSHWVEETLRDYNHEMSKLMATCTNSMKRGPARRR